MSNLHPTYDFSSDGDILSGVTPMSLLYEGPTSWLVPSSDLGGDPLFCGTPPGPNGGPVNVPGYGELPSGPNDPQDCW